MKATAQEVILDACAPVFDVLPLSLAMPSLLPASSAVTQSIEEGRDVANECVMWLLKEDRPAIAAAIWLYVDDLDRSHAISQSIPGPIGAYWHGIMHRREGDFWNAKYWFRQAQGIDLGIAGYEASRFVDQVEAARGSNPQDQVEMQRKEWMALFNYCVMRSSES